MFNALAKQEFVAENLLVRGEDRLARDKLCSRLGRGFAFIRAGSRGRNSHSLTIGATHLQISRCVGMNRSAQLDTHRKGTGLAGNRVIAD